MTSTATSRFSRAGGATPDYLSIDEIDRIIRVGVEEDGGDRDVTTSATVPPSAQAVGTFLCKEPGIVAGLLVADRVFEVVEPRLELEWSVNDGSPVEPGCVLGTVRGPARGMLTAERLALNLVQRMSGIATRTGRMVEAVRGYGARILDTRKTVPGLRLLDKWAVLLGGGYNHRIGLFDMILIKDNHIVAAGGVDAALASAAAYREASAPSMRIEIEVRTLSELDAVLAQNVADIVLLDNMARFDEKGVLDTSLLQTAVLRVGGAIETEASGNVTLETVAEIAATGVDFISSGELTHSVKALDISLELEFSK